MRWREILARKHHLIRLGSADPPSPPGEGFHSGHQIFRGFFSHCERREKVSAILLGSLRSVSKGFLTR